MRRLFAVILLLACRLALAGVAVEQWTTPSGSRVQFVPSHGLPMLDVQVDFAAGSLFDPPGKAGLAALTRATLDLGAGERDETAVAEQLADLGAQLAGGADTDRASVTLRMLVDPAVREPALAVLRDVLGQPRFDAAVVERERERTAAALRDALTRPEKIAGRAFWAALYPRHPYGVAATPESIAALRRDELMAFHAHYYNATNASITLVGDISRAEAEAIAAALSRELPAGRPAALPAPPGAPRSGLQKIAHPASQAHIYLGLPAVERGHPDYFPLLVGNYTLGGGGFVSRLVREIRDKRGYAYSVYSHFSPLRQAGPFQIALQTRKAQAADAIKVTRAVLDDFLRNGPSADELAAAKANLAGSFPLRLDSNKKLLDNVAAIGFYGLPTDYLDQYQARIAAVSAADVRRAFARHVRPAELVGVAVGAE